MLYSALSFGAKSFSLELELDVDFVALDDDVDDDFLVSSSLGFDDEVSLLLLLSRE